MSGQSAIITGAAQGLGRSIVMAFAAEGASVCIADINGEKAEDVRREISDAGGSAIAMTVDVSDEGSCANCVSAVKQNFGKLDLLVNCAVFARYAPLTETDPQIVDRMLAVGIKGPLLMSKSAVGLMSASGGGAIVNISSVVSQLGVAYTSAYAALKGGIDAMTRALAVELGPLGIRVNSMAPGPIPSAMSNAVLDDDGWEERRRRVPLGRIGTSRDVVETAIFLGSQQSSFLSGVIVTVDGGFSIAGMIPGIDLKNVSRTREGNTHD